MGGVAISEQARIRLEQYLLVCLHFKNRPHEVDDNGPASKGIALDPDSRATLAHRRQLMQALRIPLAGDADGDSEIRRAILGKTITERSRLCFNGPFSIHCNSRISNRMIMPQWRMQGSKASSRCRFPRIQEIALTPKSHIERRNCRSSSLTFGGARIGLGGPTNCIRGVIPFLRRSARLRWPVAIRSSIKAAMR